MVDRFMNSSPFEIHIDTLMSLGKNVFLIVGVGYMFYFYGLYLKDPT